MGLKEINMVEIAKIAQKAEHNYVGVKCGIMDQFTSAMGKKNMAIFWIAGSDLGNGAAGYEWL